MHRFLIALAAAAAALILVPTDSQARKREHRVIAMKASDCASSNLVPTPANLETIRASTLCLLNVERTQRGRPALRSHLYLKQAADLYSRTMVDVGFFAHISPTGSTFVSRIKQSGYLARTSGWALGENLAWGEAELSSPASTVAAWMRSPDHKRNILDGRYVEIGVGVSYGTPSGGELPGATYVTEFGTRSLIVRA